MGKKIASMIVENFLSFEEASFDFSDAGFVLVEGENGAGKSAMIDGVVWCLFGTTLRGYEKDEVINRRVGKDCMVKVTIEDGAELYTVTRARRHGKLKNSLRVTHDNFGEDISLSGVDETQEVVDKLLGCTRKTFLSSVVFGQDRAYRFSSLTDGEQKKILDEVLGVERFAQACSAARKQVDKIQGDLEVNRRALERNEKALREVEVEIIDLQVKGTDFAEAQRKKIDAEREKLREAKDWLGRARKHADVEALKKKSEEAFAALCVAEKMVDSGVEVDASMRAVAASCKAKRDDAEADWKRRKKLAGDCPTCGQKVDGKKRTALLAELEKQLDALGKVWRGADKAAEKAASILADRRAELKSARDAMAAAQRALNEGISTEANAASWRRRAADHEERIKALAAERSPYAALVDKAQSRRAQLAADFDQLTAYVGEQEGQLSRAQFWVKAFGAAGLRSLLIDTSLPLLNDEASRVSRALTGGAISVEFSATSEQKSGKVVDRFEVRVDNKHGAGDYRGNSAGERAKVDLCVGLALQRLVASRSSASFNVAFFDEVFDHLDSSAHEKVVDVLSEIDKESVFVVSHDDDLKSWFPATIRIAKRGGFSRVEA